MPLQEFWDSIAAAHRVVGSESEPGRPVLTPDPLESEPESDEEDRTDGIFSPQFMQSTGVQCASQEIFYPALVGVRWHIRLHARAVST